MIGRYLLATSLIVGVGASGHHAWLVRRAQYTRLDTNVAMSDGVKLAVTYYRPSGTPPPRGWPAVMMFHGLGQTRSSTELGWSENGVAETYLAPAGYSVLTFDERAHGESGGSCSLDGPRELADTRELYSWLTSRTEVDGSNVGAFGISYGGGMVWLATAAGVPFKAIVPAATWIDLRAALAPQSLLREGVLLGLLRNEPASRYTGELRAVLEEATSQGNADGVRAFLASRSIGSRLGSISVPTLLVQGRRDFAFDADQALIAYRKLHGPKRLLLGDLGHAPAANPPDEQARVAREAVAWFDQYLKGEPGLVQPRVEVAPDPWSGKTVTYASLPRTRSLRFTSTKAAVLTSRGSVVRTFRRLRHAETFGAPVVRVTASSRTNYDHVVAVLTAVRADGKEVVVSDGGIGRLHLTRRPRRFAIRLQNEITPIPSGARIRLYLGATSTVQDPANAVYLIPVADGETLTVNRISLTLPVLRRPISP